MFYVLNVQHPQLVKLVYKVYINVYVLQPKSYKSATNASKFLAKTIKLLKEAFIFEVEFVLLKLFWDRSKQKPCFSLILAKMFVVKPEVGLRRSAN